MALLVTMATALSLVGLGTGVASGSAVSSAPQFQVVSSGSQTLVGGGTATLKASCPGVKGGGQYAVSGGFVADLAYPVGLRALSNGPADLSKNNNSDGVAKATAWQVLLANTGANADQATAYAICANAEAAAPLPQWQVVSSGSQVLASGATVTVKATCPDVNGGGQYAVGGGFVADYAKAAGLRDLSDAPANVSQDNNSDGVAKATAWQVLLANTGDQGVQVTAYAVCANASAAAPLPQWQVITSSNVLNPAAIRMLTQTCPGGTVAIGGGFAANNPNTASAAGIRALSNGPGVATENTFGSATAWQVLLENASFNQVEVTASVVCANAPAVTPTPPASVVVSVSPTPVAVGAQATVTVSTVDASNDPVPFPGGPITFSLGAADPAATIGGQAIGSVGKVTLDEPESPSGTLMVPAVFEAAQTGQSVSATFGSVQGQSAVFDVATALGTGIGTPGAPLNLTAGDAGGNLPNGSVGPVSLFTQPCDTSDPTCKAGVQVTLQGTFTTPDGTELYSDMAPAGMTWTCSAAQCPGPWTYLRNGHYTRFDQVLDFTRYRLEMSLRVNGADLPFAQAASCRNLLQPRQWGETGQVVSSRAQKAGFCVDVFALKRNSAGALTIQTLFVQDPRMRPS